MPAIAQQCCSRGPTSSTASRVDVQAIIDAAAKHCLYVAASLALMDAFGLRVKESVMTHPHEDVGPIEPDEFDDERPPRVTHTLAVRGAKGDRPRKIPIETEKQWAALRRAQALAAPGQPMGRPGRMLKANLERLHRVLRKIGTTGRKLGVTAHGLRHQRCNDEFENVTGEPSPVRGGGPIDAELERAARDETLATTVVREEPTTLVGDGVGGRFSCWVDDEVAGADRDFPLAMTEHTGSRDDKKHLFLQPGRRGNKARALLLFAPLR